MRTRLTGAVAILVLAALIAAAAAAAQEGSRPGHQAAGEGPLWTGRLLVQLDVPARPAGEGPAAQRARRDQRRSAAQLIDRVAARNALRVAAEVPKAGLLAVRPRPGQDLADLRRQVLADPRVERAFPEPARQLRRYYPNDPALHMLTGGRTTLGGTPLAPNGDIYQWQLHRQNLPMAWGYSRGAGARVAIIDTGVDASHPDLGPRIVRQQAHGTLFPNTDPDGHGTHVAGLACGDSDNGYGMASAGFRCGIIVEKMAFTDAAIIAAIYDAADHGADAINMSFGGSSANASMKAAIDYAWARGAISVAAADNNPVTHQGYPAAYVQPPATGPIVNSPLARGIVVTMAQYNGTNANAGRGAGITMAAYGDSSISPPTAGIFSTWPSGVACGCRVSFQGDTRFAYLFGTSMATPQVAGAVALIRARRPGMAAWRVVHHIKLTARRAGGPWSGFTNLLGWGILDAGQGVAGALGIDVTRPFSRLRSPRRTRSRRFPIRVRRNDPLLPGRARSGVRRVHVFVARGRRGFRLLRRTRRGRIWFRGRPGATYRFFSRAVDRAGNWQPRPPRRLHTRTRVVRRAR